MRSPAATARAGGPDRRVGTPVVVHGPVSLLLWGLACAGAAAAVGHGIWSPELGDLVFGLVQGLLAVVYATAGARLVARWPANPVGWILLLVGAFQGVSGGAFGLAILLREHGLPVAAELMWLSNWIWAPSLALLAVGLPSLFPDGRPLSRRWAAVVTVAAAATVVGTAAKAVGDWGIRDLALVATPEDFDALAARIPAAYTTAFDLALAVMAVCAILAVASLVVRFRRARGVQRAQLKWFAFGGSVTVLGTSLTFLVPGPFESSAPLSFLWGVGILGALTAAPVAVTVAVLRYRLYEIDRLVSRTLAYTVLTGALVVLYGVGVLLAGTLVGPFDGGSQVAVALSTLLVATLFHPLRRRVQAAVDRRFNRSRYDAQGVVAALAGRLRDDIDLPRLRAHLLEAVDLTLAPARRELWLVPTPTNDDH